MDSSELNNRFAFHSAATEGKRDGHAGIGIYCLALAEFLNDRLPEGREKSLAITHLEEVMFWSNAGLARMKE